MTVCVDQMINSSFVVVDVTGPSVFAGASSVVFFLVVVVLSGNLLYPHSPSLLCVGSMVSVVPDVQMHEVGPSGSWLHVIC